MIGPDGVVAARHHTTRDLRYPTRGGQVARLAKAKGRPLMPWQRKAVDVALEYDPATGLYRYTTVVMSVPRQSGKTKLESDVADHRCLSKPEARCWITMQNGKTADSWMREEHFAALRRASAVFGAPGDKSARYEQSRRAGEVGVAWGEPFWSTFYTFPPKRDALHSKQSDLAIVDEAWAHNAETGADLRQAIRPTMNTRPGAQLWIVSTMGTDASVYFDGYVQQAIAQLDQPGSRTCIIDYGLAPDDDPEDLDLVASKHPAYGFILTMDALADAREDFRTDPTLGGPAGWARAYGNVPTRNTVAAIPAQVWTDASRPGVPLPPRRGVALDVTPDGRRAVIGGAFRDDEGVAHLEVVHAGPVDHGLAQRVVDVARASGSPIYVDRAAYAALEVTDAIAKIRNAPDVRFLSMAEFAGACGVVDRGLRDGTVVHHNDPDLDAAAEVATKRDLGDGMFGWGRKGSTGSVAELIASSIAVKAYDNLPAAKRKGRARAGVAA